MLLHIFFALVFVLGASPIFAQTGPQGPCDDSLDALLSVLVAWSTEVDSSLDYGYVACATGAGLTLTYDVASGFTIAPRQKLRWPGNLFISSDSAYSPWQPRSWNEAESLMVRVAESEERQLLYGPDPLVLTGVDTSFGAPWFFLSHCDSGVASSVVWDRVDFRAVWWRWADLPGANWIWPVPKNMTIKLGRKIVHAGMRNLVLAARPDSLGTQYYGLSALTHAQIYPEVPPGSTSELRRLARLRIATADFLGRAADFWPPAKREPVRLAAFFLQKDAEAWLTLSAVSGTWSSYDSGQRSEWLASLADWETKAAVALDQIISSSD